MEQTSCSMTRNFSAIAPLQSSFTLTYDIKPYKKDLFSFTIQRSGANDSQKSITVSTSGNQAQEFLQFLYENAVHPEHLEDFAYDFYNLSLCVDN